ncbi:KTSC domain-containing protein [Flavobacterium sp. SUN052]|uniref:KTSC domain-containing protein n=1 Tax=Flavobacterium sp. SUN052 TaxID=3002441 RepID=UPI00237DC92C|nr:KTSC domain-containing protein [Flavobacterium sp. SUN052]MEC4003072.1 KTSC domain-containing protein [Flavobacterium sp. SUN052]
MNQYAIQSSNILFIGYNEVNNVLEIEFKLSVVHQYFDVPLDEFVALMKSTDTEEFYFNFIYCKYHYDAF